MRLIFCLLLTLSCGAIAAQDLDTYSARVNVADQSPNERGRALREAMSIVINRVTGDPKTSTSPRGQALLTRASQLSRSIGYETDEKDQLQLVVNVAPDALEAALRQSGLPVFGVFASNVEEVVLSVSGVNSARDYSRVMSFLRGQPGMRSVMVTNSAGGTLQLRAKIEGGTGRLAGALTVGNTLKRDTSVTTGLSYLLLR